MGLFDQLVDEALRSQEALAPLQLVVEKELLHHDILREMSHAGLLAKLTFMGGTCLRLCYGSNRLSEDLDFTAGRDFDRETFVDLGVCIVEGIRNKYGLTVEVSAPVKDTGSVDTWKIKVITRPDRKDLPAQKINIDISAIPSYERKPLMLRNRYSVDMGTSGLIVQAQSREEILADKMVALALRPNRVKWRDIWDIVWLKQQNIVIPLPLIAKKAADHKRDKNEFMGLLKERVTQISNDPESHSQFLQEMRRFLPPKIVIETISQPDFWSYVAELISVEMQAIEDSLV